MGTLWATATSGPVVKMLNNIAATLLANRVC